jgi:hemerythrin
MKWKDEYTIGIEPIDEQHKSLFQIAGDFRDALDEGKGERTYGLLLRILDTYTRAHFGIEEQCMQQHRCPVAEKNKNAHSKLIETLSGFQNRYHASGYDHAEASRLVDTLEQWLADHICRIDMHLKKCVKKSDTNALHPKNLDHNRLA